MSELLPKWIVIREDDRREQRRYEIARDVMAALVGDRLRLPNAVVMAVVAADALLAELEKSDDVS